MRSNLLILEGNGVISTAIGGGEGAKVQRKKEVQEFAPQMGKNGKNLFFAEMRSANLVH